MFEYNNVKPLKQVKILNFTKNVDSNSTVYKFLSTYDIQLLNPAYKFAFSSCFARLRKGIFSTHLYFDHLIR